MFRLSPSLNSSHARRGAAMLVEVCSSTGYSSLLDDDDSFRLVLPSRWLSESLSIQSAKRPLGSGLEYELFYTYPCSRIGSLTDLKLLNVWVFNAGYAVLALTIVGPNRQKMQGNHNRALV